MRSLFLSRNPVKTASRFYAFQLRPRIAIAIVFPLSLRSYSVNSAPGSSSSAEQMAMPPRMAMVSHVDSEVGLANRLWAKFRRETVFSMYTPFCVSLASGNLNIDTFRHYISQDVHFLKAFARAYELAEECADDDDAKVSITKLRKAVLTELKMHDSFVKEWASDVAKEFPISPATAKYTDFLLATADGRIEGLKGLGNLATPFERTKVAAYTLGAMTPCMRLYAFLGKEFKTHLDADKGDHLYKKWINNYSSEAFEEAAVKTEDLLEKLSVSLTGEELDTIEKLYHQAMKLELDFFSSQPVQQKTVVPLIKEHNPAEECLMLFSDFDLTCTVVDSSAILAELAIVTAPKPDQSPTEDQIVRMSSADLKNTWVGISKQYTEEYEECIERIMPSEAVEFRYEELCKALEQLCEFETRANNRVIESGVLKGINSEDIRRAGQRLILQEGCFNFFGSAIEKENVNSTIHVLSYCWCGDLIRSSFTSGGLPEVNIHANELMYEDSISTGEIVKKVESPVDKVLAFRKIVENCGNDRKNLTVYIGDSVGDLLCLLEADIGIVIGSSSSLRRLATKFGVSFTPLYPSIVKKQRDCDVNGHRHWKGLSGVLYTVSSWAEIHSFILGC